MVYKSWRQVKTVLKFLDDDSTNVDINKASMAYCGKKKKQVTW